MLKLHHCLEESSKDLLLNQSETHKLKCRYMKAKEQFFQYTDIARWYKPHFCCSGKGRIVYFYSNY